MRAVCVAVPFLALAVLTSIWPLGSDHDLYLHLTMGRLMSEMKMLLRYDVLSYTAAGAPDETHSWLAQLILWKVFAAGGETGLRVLRFFLIGSVLGLIVAYVWRRTREPALIAFVGIVVVLIHREKFNLRPFLFGEVAFFIATLFLIRAPASLTRWRALALFVLAFAWANLHGSVVLLVPLVTLYSLAAALRGERDWLTLLSPVWVAMATLINPQGPALYTYAWEVSRLGKSLLNPEWVPKSAIHFAGGGLVINYDVSCLIQLTAMIVVPAILFLERASLAEKMISLGVNALVLSLSMDSRRHHLFFSFTLAYMVTRAWSLWPPVPSSRAHWRAGLTVGSLLLLFAYQFPRFEGKVVAIERGASFLREAGVTGNAFNEPGWGSYLSYRLYPEIKIAWNYRNWVHRDLYVTAAENTRKYHDTRLHELVLSLPDTDLVIFPSQVPIRGVIVNPEEWVTVFENNRVGIVLRKSPRNRENISRIERYYSARKIPFNRKTGFDARMAYLAAPDWFAAQQETPDWGAWPSESVKASWHQLDELFFEGRGLVVRDVL